ncbi:metallophosphoesterase [Mesobacillus foraminis]|uniref:metallophosphoesterase n=1 Tax=Mesobacillus foraminis TaxID=279826 RepID=UPI00399FAE84
MSILSILAGIFFILLYAAICFYVGYNGWVWLKTTRMKVNKWFYIGLLVMLSASIILGQFITFQPLKIVGGFWMVVIGYSLFLIPIANLLVYFFKKKGLFWIGLSIVLFFSFVFIYGSYNAWNPVIRSYDIYLNKQEESNDLKILMVSDIHLGQIVGVKHLERLVDKVEEVNPDIVLIPGDIIDDHIEPFIKEDMGKVLERINAPLGVYAIPGNHDYYGNDLNRMVAEVEKAGIKVLMDETVLINDGFYLIGRKDLTDDHRKKVSDLTRNLDHSKPVIMMDHQPYDLDIAEKNGVDLLLSGHTHRGQLSPAHLITDRIYENDWGYLQKKNLHSLVSSGFGTWGPPLRLGSRSEVMVINLKFGTR